MTTYRLDQQRGHRPRGSEAQARSLAPTKVVADAVDLLADERLSRDDRAAFRAEAVEVASALGPARLTAEQAEPTGRERNCDG